MKLALAPLMLVVAMVGCEPKAPTVEGPVPENYLTQKTRCEARGGRWGQGGAGDFFICYMTTRDAGKQCRKGTDCEGLCLARSGTCAPVTPLFGCQDVFNDDGSRGTLCVD